MNALDLLHKIRTCDKHGNFTYPDTTVLNDLIEMIQGAEAAASEIATERERLRCMKMAEGGAQFVEHGEPISFVHARQFAADLARDIVDQIRSGDAAPDITLNVS